MQSHNAEMDRSLWPPARMIHVRDVAEAAAIMQISGAPVKLWSVDCEAFYRKMGRRRAEVWRNVMAVPDGFQVDMRCCFGSAADAASARGCRISWRMRAERRLQRSIACIRRGTSAFWIGNALVGERVAKG